LKRTLWSIQQNLDVQAQIVVAEVQQSVARNRLHALERFSGDVVIFMDDDVILPPCFASKLIATLDALDDAGVVSAIMTNPDGSRQNNVFCSPEKTIGVLPPGTCFCYSRKRLKDCAFDPRYEASQWEDTDFMVQVQEMGLKTVATGSVWVLHDNQWTGHTSDTWRRNRERFARKWPAWAEKFGLNVGGPTILKGKDEG